MNDQPAPSKPPPAQRIYGEKYRAEEVIGRGAFGVVYRGIELNLNRQVAIKVLSFEGAEMRARFLREARILASLEHPNVVAIYAFGEQDDELYFVMRYAPGPVLSYAAHGAGRTAADVLSLIAPIAVALDFAHERGVVHRDLKPQNICFTENEDPLLLDFGIARGPDHEAVTRAGQSLGTPYYMSPEQARAQAPTAASDQYSLALILFELLTGTRAFDGDSALSIVFQQVNDPPPSPRQFRPDLPPEIEPALLRALSKDPKDRFESCLEFFEAMGHEFIDATPAPGATGSHSAAPAPLPPAETLAPAIRVLIVEDEVTDVLILKRQLAAADLGTFEFDHVMRLADVAARLKTTKVDVVLLDLSLPDSDGLATLERALDLVGERPIVVQTGVDDQHTARRALQLGAQDYVVKGTTDGRSLARAMVFAWERKRIAAGVDPTPLYERLTGLPNRALLLDRLQLAVARSKRSGTGVTVVWLSFDPGPREATRSELREITRRLRSVVDPWDTIAYLGRGRFVCVFEDRGTADTAAVQLQWVRAAVEDPDRVWYGGVAVAPMHGEDPEVLLAHAQAASVN